jgi:hypothetical protein
LRPTGIVLIRLPILRRLSWQPLCNHPAAPPRDHGAYTKGVPPRPDLILLGTMTPPHETVIFGPAAKKHWKNGRRLSAQASHLRQCEAAVTPPSGAGHRRSNAGAPLSIAAVCGSACSPACSRSRAARPPTDRAAGMGNSRASSRISSWQTAWPVARPRVQ